MKRRGARVIFCLTLALLVVVASAWVASHFVAGCFAIVRKMIVVDRGAIVMVQCPNSLPAPDMFSYSIGNDRSGVDWDVPLVPGFRFLPNMTAVRFFWPTLAAAIAATIQYRRLGNGQLPGGCPACNYDLRATPDRCPECGHVVTPRSKTEV
jgi:hypothetical protein